jgi:hypothetical protein
VLSDSSRKGFVLWLLIRQRQGRMSTKMLEAGHHLLLRNLIALNVELLGLNLTVVFEHFFGSLSRKEGAVHAGGGTPRKEDPSIFVLVRAVAHDKNVRLGWPMIQLLRDFGIVPNDEGDLLHPFH